ncbi:MAG: flippase-like domain-containing protein [Bacteroidia bacterium]|nr:flippase-like domain-containing protein [Bacteroidia bacterium]
MLNHKNNFFIKYYKPVIKIVILLLSYGFILYKLLQQNDLTSLFSPFIKNEKAFVLFFLVIALMPVNWGIETLKWKFLVKKLEKISFINCFRAVLSGTTISVFTPNHVGEFAGRILVLKSENMLSGVFSTITGSISQLSVTLLAGTAALLWFIFSASENINIPIQYLFIIFIVGASLTLFIFLLFFNLKAATALLNRLKILSKYRAYYGIFSEYKWYELILVLLGSLFRYIVFVLQYYLLLLFFDIQINIEQAFSAVAIIYLLSTIIPSFALAELGIRSSVALVILGMFSGNDAGIIASSLLLWIINLAVPALIGSFYFARMKV